MGRQILNVNCVVVLRFSVTVDSRHALRNSVVRGHACIATHPFFSAVITRWYTGDLWGHDEYRILAPKVVFRMRSLCRVVGDRESWWWLVVT